MTDHQPITNGQGQLDTLRADIFTFSNLLNQLQTFVLFRGLVGALPRPVLEDAAQRLEALLTMIRAQMEE